tara:strand:+ start:168 stop:569 length:402 start_codon:yes stop_codon:yes gene_type:complete
MSDSYRKRFPKGKDWKTPKKNPYGFCGLNESSYHGMEVIGVTKEKYEELEQKLEQQTQDYHFDMRNKQMELVMLQSRLDTLEAANVTLAQGFDDLERENKELRKHQLELVMENGELKDMVLDLGGDYTENKGE